MQMAIDSLFLFQLIIFFSKKFNHQFTYQFRLINSQTDKILLWKSNLKLSNIITVYQEGNAFALCQLTPKKPIIQCQSFVAPFYTCKQCETNMQVKYELTFRGKVNADHRNINNTSAKDVKTIWNCLKIALPDTIDEVCETKKNKIDVRVN